MYRLAPLSLAIGLAFSTSVLADATPQTLPFSQDWNDTGLIVTNDNWDGVPGVIGYRGDGLTGSTGANPQTLMADGTTTPVDVNANQTNPNTYATGGVAEFEIADPVVALNGSGTADAPFLLFHLDTTGKSGIRVAYTLRDLDGSVDDATQPIALQYRVGNAGDFTDVPAAYVADATEGPSLSGKTTGVSVLLPAAADNQPLLQVRVMTSNAAGNDEWVGVDDIVISAGGGAVVTNAPIVPACPASLAVDAGGAASVQLSASDADSVVNAATITSAPVAGLSLSGFASALVDGGSASVQLDAANVAAGTYPVDVRFDNDEAQSASCTVNVVVTGVTPIYDIQGAGTTSPLAGQTVTTQGVVTQLNNNGFYLQDPVGDGDVTTSDGVFVFTGSAPAVAVGDLVRLTARVAEYNTGAASNALTAANPLTELTNSANLVVLGNGQIVPPTVIPFPEAFEGELERYEGMLVRIDTELTASQNYFQGRYGQVTLAAGGRLIKPTNVHRANTPEAQALADANALRRIILDDGTSLQNPNPIPYIGDDDTLRAGDTLPGLTGVIDYGLATSSSAGLADYRIHPVGDVVFTRANPRTAAPAAVGGNVRVASFNVLNYFTTFTDGATADGLTGQGCALDGSVSAGNCRGADNLAEFQRQQAKIVAALAAMNADVVGLMEIQNNGNAAAQNLVDALNAVVGAGTYAVVGLPSGGTGSDAIRVAMIYKPAVVTPVGGALSDTAAVHNRPPLAQTFAAANGEAFSVVVNHFKSKGSCPADGDVNADQGDGQGCWNVVRTEQAQALRSFVGGLSDPDALVIGDLNAYGMEDPVADLVDNGYVDQIARFNGGAGYSYVFDGESGYLDHALATATLSAQIAGAEHWHINADEPFVIDYNLEFKPQDLYAPNAYRSSDHDPVVVGLRLVKTVNGSSGRDTLVGSAGDDVLTGGPGADRLTGGAGRDVFVYTSVLDGVDTLADFTPGEDHIDLSALLVSLGVPAASALSGGYVLCATSGAAGVLRVDPDGSAGSAAARNLAKVNGVSCAALLNAGNFLF